jgi:hypothetical protein
MALDNNPLKQYFRRPAVFIKLPSGGKYYPAGVIDMPENGELPVYPMTAIDEITTKTPDALYNGTAMAELIKSCVPSIKDPWQINSMDLDAVLIGIRAAAGGSDLEIESTCPACEDYGKYGINLVNMLAQMRPGDYENEFKINDLAIKFRPLNYREMNEASIGQFEIQRAFVMLEQETDEEVKKEKGQEALRRVTQLTIKLLTGAIEYIQTPTVRVSEKEFIMDFLNNCDKNMYVSIRDYNAELKSTSEIKPLQIKCVHCNHQYEQPFTLNTSDFFG